MSDQSSNGQAIEVPAADSELYQPPQSAIDNANVANYLDLRNDALTDIEAYWDARARELIDWFEPYEKVLDSSGAPFLQVVCRWENQHRPQRIGPTHQWLAQTQAGIDLGSGGWRKTDL